MRKVIENVSGLYIIKSENYMFDGCMHSIMQLLGERPDYDYTFFSAVTGDTFTQLACRYPEFGFVDSLSNHQKYSGEGIKLAFDGCGYSYAHVTKKEIQANKKLWINEIISSINKGVPVLTFGIVGPPTCSMICGYDEDGEVLIGWAQFQNEAEKEPNGYFRKRNGLDESEALIFFGQKIKEVPLSETYRNTFENIPMWTNLLYENNEKSNNVFGVKAFTDWGNSLLIDELFSDNEKMPERQDAHCGMLCIAATNLCYMPETLRRIKTYCPDLKVKIDTLSAIYEKQNSLCEKIFAVQNGFWIDEEKLSDSKIRKELSDIIKNMGKLQEEFSAIIK